MIDKPDSKRECTSDVRHALLVDLEELQLASAILTGEIKGATVGIGDGLRYHRPNAAVFGLLIAYLAREYEHVFAQHLGGRSGGRRESRHRQVRPRVQHSRGAREQRRRVPDERAAACVGNRVAVAAAIIVVEGELALHRFRAQVLDEKSARVGRIWIDHEIDLAAEKIVDHSR